MAGETGRVSFPVSLVCVSTGPIFLPAAESSDGWVTGSSLLSDSRLLQGARGSGDGSVHFWWRTLYPQPTAAFLFSEHVTCYTAQLWLPAGVFRTIIREYSLLIKY